jgi:hypothetical protein
MYMIEHILNSFDNITPRQIGADPNVQGVKGLNAIHELVLSTSAMGLSKLPSPYRQQREEMAGFISPSRSTQHDSLHTQIFGQRGRGLAIGFGGILHSSKLLQRILAALVTAVDNSTDVLATSTAPLQEIVAVGLMSDISVPESDTGLVMKYRRALAEGCRSSIFTAAGNTPLAFAARREGCNLSLAKMLLFRRPEIATIQNSAGDTALILAVAEKNEILVQAIIARYVSLLLSR